MKKRLALVMACVMCFGLCACNVEEKIPATETTPPAADSIVTPLTLDNYEDYFEISYTETECGDSFYSYVLSNFFYEKIQYDVDVKGLKQKCTYQDVQITISLEGGYGGISRYIDTTSDDDAVTDMIPFELTLFITQTDENGNAQGEQFLDPPAPYYTRLSLAVLLDVKVVSVSGTVVETI